MHGSVSGHLSGGIMSDKGCHLNIGPIRFVLRSCADAPMRYKSWGYRDFFEERDTSASPRPLVELPVRIERRSVELPSGSPVYESGKNWAVWPDGDHWLFCSRYAGRDRPLFACRVNRDLTQAALFVDDERTVDPLCYPIDQILSWGLLTRCGGVLMHSALVERDGAGLLLAGRSGAGKSTLAELCRKQGWRGLNDDRVVAFQRNGAARAAGTPWHGTGLLAEAGEVAPMAILLLQQSVSERLERVPPAIAKLALLDVVSIPWFEEDWSKDALEALDALADAIPVYRFSFSCSPSAAEALELFSEVRV